MKRLTLTAYILLLAMFVSNAQENTGSSSNPLFYGVKVGGVHSTFRTDYQFKFAEHRLGIAAGANVGYKINKLLSIQLDVLYVQEGASYVPPDYLYYEPDITADANNTDVERLNSNVVMHTLETPLRVNIHLDEGGLKPKLFAGATFNYLFYAETKNKLIVEDNTEEYYAEIEGRTSDEITSRLNNYYFGGLVGASVSFETFGMESVVEARLKLGLQKINNLGTLRYPNKPSDWEVPESYLDDISVQTLMITYGINF